MVEDATMRPRPSLGPTATRMPNWDPPLRFTVHIKIYRGSMIVGEKEAMMRVSHGDPNRM
jgi:hypothetical protein